MSVSKGLAEAVREFIVTKAASDSGPPAETFASEPVWQALTSHGTRLWLDTGSVLDAADLWNGEFDALTTNNTLLNKEVQNGQYDEVVPEAATLLASREIGMDALMNLAGLNSFKADQAEMDQRVAAVAAGPGTD